ncbi:MAG: SAM-dependent methyltransferase [Defluviitaleaceae bacterium]|nr:SAM-dependent methyltransferase [Defluviitaleaceae bacterium]
MTYFNESIYKIVLSVPKEGKYTRVEILRNGEKYQASMYTEKQVFHSNHDLAGIKAFISANFGALFSCYHAWDSEYEYSARVTKKGKILSSRKKTAIKPKQNSFAAGSFNREKNHIIREGVNIPALVDMGVFTKDLKVAAPMRDKFNQINRFLELLADEVKGLKGTVNIIDFGCGKSYLTFIVDYYFTKILKLPTNICGMDLDEGIVQKCAAAAEKYGCKSLKFVQGDIGGLDAPPLPTWGEDGTFNIVISLHACDTATDYALYNAIKWQADLVCAVPCCQHELRDQMRPKTLGLLCEYGIIKERIASLLTDTIRAKLLEICGYKVQVIELVGLDSTAKNLMIRGRRGSSGGCEWAELEGVLGEFGVEPMLWKLLGETHI